MSNLYKVCLHLIKCSYLFFTLCVCVCDVYNVSPVPVCLCVHVSMHFILLPKWSRPFCFCADVSLGLAYSPFYLPIYLFWPINQSENYDDR